MQFMNKATDYIQQMSSDTVGKVCVAIGVGGTTVQVITEWSNLFVIGGNALLVIAGLFLLLYNLRK
jgi:hypothetical protein